METGACCCVYVDDEPTLYNAQMVTARKHHKCCECGTTVNPGELYERVKLLMDGRWWSYDTCDFCRKVWRDFFSCGVLHGGLSETFQDCYGYDYMDPLWGYEDDEEDAA